MKKIAWPIIIVLVLLLLAGGFAFYQVKSSAYDADMDACIYIDNDDDMDSLQTKLETAGVSTSGMTLLAKVRSFSVRTGRYVIKPGTSAWTLFGKLRNGQQDAVNMTVPSVRTLDRLAGAMTHNLMLDSLTLLNALQDEDFIGKYGYTKETLPALIIPNTYQVFWDISLEKVMDRLVNENKKFWTDERLQKAKAIKLTPNEVVTLASIVDEETANNEEKPMVAGLYLNRLEKDMLLQADPTVKVAVGDWSLRRVLGVHLQCDSPYNTYKYKGLPPGPLRIVSQAGIDAVLNYAHHDYLYMCAKEDFSGTHNFAVTYAEHMQNARRYINALNANGIK